MLTSIDLTGKGNLEGLPNKVKRTLRKTFSFKNGLNIIVGPNGCGKTTLLNVIKAWYGIDGQMHHNTTKWPVPNFAPHKFWEETIAKRIKNTTINRSYQIGVDGNQFFDFKANATYHLNPMLMTQLYDGSFLSNGEQKMEAHYMLTQYLSDFSIGEIRTINDEKIEEPFEQYPILFFDEPTLGMSPEVEMQFFEYMSQWSKKYQILVVTNSPFCFVPEANIIQLKRGYIKHQKEMLERALINIQSYKCKRT